MSDKHPAPKTVFLHVGAPKTGTTFLQRTLWKNRERLAADGVYYPLQGLFEHFPAVLDLRRMDWGGRWNPEWDGAWGRVAERARTWEGPTVLFSNELLGGATQRQARRAVESFGAAEVHVILTVRDLARQMPSGWQEHLKHRHAASFDEFLDDLIDRGSHGRYGRPFWRLHEVTDVLRRWNAAVPADRIHIVTVPPPDAPKGLLWERFATVVGIEARRYETRVPRSNVSVGVVEAELLRRINGALDGRLPGRAYDQAIRVQLAEATLAARPHASRIFLPAERYPWVLERSTKLVASIRAAGYDVVGDLDELLPSPPRTAGGVRHPDDATVPELLDVAVDAMANLLRGSAPALPRQAQFHERIQELEQELAHRHRQPVRAMLGNISRNNPAPKRARGAWRRAIRKVQGF